MTDLDLDALEYLQAGEAAKGRASVLLTHGELTALIQRIREAESAIKGWRAQDALQIAALGEKQAHIAQLERGLRDIAEVTGSWRTRPPDDIGDIQDIVRAALEPRLTENATAHKPGSDQ